MTRMIFMAGIIASLLGVLGCTKQASQAATTDHFVVGQVWKYKTRASEEDSRLIIGKIETLEKSGNVVHIKLIRLKIKSPTAPGGYSTNMSHAPITESKLQESVTELTNEKADIEGFEEGYNTWRDAKGGVFTITVNEIVDFIEKAINK